MKNQNINSTPVFIEKNRENSNQNSLLEPSTYTFDKNKIQSILKNMKKNEPINISPIVLDNNSNNSQDNKGLNSFNLNSNKNQTEQNDYSSNNNYVTESYITNKKNNYSNLNSKSKSDIENESNINSNNNSNEEEEEDEEGEYENDEESNEETEENNKEYKNKNFENENKRMTIEYIKILSSLSDNDKSIKELMEEYNIINTKNIKTSTIIKSNNNIINLDDNNTNNNTINNNSNINKINNNNDNFTEEKDKIIFDFDNDIQNMIELDYETELICNVSIPKIVCMNNKLYLMYITPNLNNDCNIYMRQLENKNNVYFFLISNLTTCFRKNNNTFTLQYIQNKTFQKISLDIITKTEEDCEKYVNGINYLIRNRKI